MVALQISTDSAYSHLTSPVNTGANAINYRSILAHPPYRVCVMTVWTAMLVEDGIDISMRFSAVYVC